MADFDRTIRLTAGRCLLNDNCAPHFWPANDPRTLSSLAEGDDSGLLNRFFHINKQFSNHCVEHEDNTLMDCPIGCSEDILIDLAINFKILDDDHDLYEEKYSVKD